MPAKLITLEASKTYATRENAVKAVEKLYGNCDVTLRYFVQQNEQGRFFPVFIGQECLKYGVHFNFSVVG